MNNFTIDRIDYYYEKALEIYCDSESVTIDKISEEDMQEVYLYAGNHIGFFLTWVIKHDFISDEHKDNEGVKQVKEETMTGTEFLIKYCDMKLLSSDIAETLIPFVEQYYETRYFREYCDWVIHDLCDLPMEFIGTWEEYYEFEHVIDKAYEDFLKSL